MPAIARQKKTRDSHLITLWMTAPSKYQVPALKISAVQRYDELSSPAQF